MPTTGRAHLETWSYAKPFVIARGVLTDAQLLVVELSDGRATGRGEACPVPYFGMTPDGELAKAQEMLERLARGEDWSAMHDQLPAGAARNALDCAVWDLRAKSEGRSVGELLGQPPLRPVVTAFTLGIDEPDAMADSARLAAGRHSLLKIKLGDAAKDRDRIEAIRSAAPGVRLIADVNEAWTIDELVDALPTLRACGVEMIEQPLRAGRDDALAEIEHLVPIGADESCFTTADLDRVARLYDVINIKLDKCGGLTEAMRMIAQAEALGLDVMVGCMMATSLGIAPGVIVAQHCRFVDLDAPLMLRGDRDPALAYQGDQVQPPSRALWG
jgi:L-alanine-DL-glutamate epimerase-like enolase superfamily enzyme